MSTKPRFRKDILEDTHKWSYILYWISDGPSFQSSYDHITVESTSPDDRRQSSPWCPGQLAGRQTQDSFALSERPGLRPAPAPWGPGFRV